MVRYKSLLLLVGVILSCYTVFAQERAKYTHPERLENGILTITVSYGAVACECAQWVLTGKRDKKEYIFLEPASKQLIDADKIWDGVHLPLKLRLTGKFYAGTGFPENYNPAKGESEPAKVFRYDKIEILSSYFKKH